MDVATAPERLRSLPSWLLAQLSLAARRDADEVFDRRGVHRSQFAALASLEEFGPMSQAELSGRSGLDRGDTVRLIDDLAAHLLVARTRDADDRRRNVVSITAAGRRVLRELDTDLRRAQSATLRALSGPEQSALVGLLQQALTGIG